MRRILDFSVAVLGLATLSASPGASNTSSTAATASPHKQACETPEFRQFDFWIGKWTVRNPDGKEVGSSEISQASEGCALREQWKSASDTTGMSINYYDANERQWHQDWVGSDGTILHLRGGVQGSTMVLSGEVKSPQGTVTNRITWTPLADRKVKQEWATSSDGGKTWQIAFVGIYERQL